MAFYSDSVHALVRISAHPLAVFVRSSLLNVPVALSGARPISCVTSRSVFLCTACSKPSGSLDVARQVTAR